MAEKTTADVAWCRRAGFDPACCNWCDRLLADDPEPARATSWICSRCVDESNQMRDRLTNG